VDEDANEMGRLPHVRCKHHSELCFVKENAERCVDTKFLVGETRKGRLVRYHQMRLGRDEKERLVVGKIRLIAERNDDDFVEIEISNLGVAVAGKVNFVLMSERGCAAPSVVATVCVDIPCPATQTHVGNSCPSRTAHSYYLLT
jgi:hypothetical protein